MGRIAAFEKNGCLTELQAERLRKVRALAAEGLLQGHAASRCGLSGPALSSFLGGVLGEYGWPPLPELVERALALPVLSQSEFRAKARRERERASARGPTRSVPAAAGVEPEEIERRIEARVAARQAEHRVRESRWLDEEQTKYGLPQRGTPLSEMPV